MDYDVNRWIVLIDLRINSFTVYFARDRRIFGGIQDGSRPLSTINHTSLVLGVL